MTLPEEKTTRPKTYSHAPGYRPVKHAPPRPPWEDDDPGPLGQLARAIFELCALGIVTAAVILFLVAVAPQ